MQIDPDKVIKVYSGKLGCMCGCKGKWTYSSKYREFGAAQRGYPVLDEDVNDRTVKIIVGKLNRNADTKWDDGIAYYDSDTRTLAAYTTD